MAIIGTASVNITPSMKGFSSKINSAIGSVNGTKAGASIGSSMSVGIAGGIKKGSAALMGGIAGIAASAFDSVISGVVALGSEMVAAADGAQKFAQTLQFAGLDDSIIKQLTKSTQEYADQTVYDLNDIRNVTAQLASNGVNDYAKLAEAAGNLNAVAGGNAETFKSVGMVMTQTAGTGKLMTENWNQLTDAIPGASGALQDAMRDAGAFEGNFREAMEKGEISADEFFAAVQKLGMQDIAIEAATSTSTIEGALGNLKASIVGVGANVITALTPAITGVMNLLSTGIGKVSEGFGMLLPYLAPIGEAVMTAIAPLASKLQEAGTAIGSSVLPYFQQLGTFLQGIMPVFTLLVSTIASIVATLVGFLLPILQQIYEAVAPIMAQVMQIVNELLPVLVEAISVGLESLKTMITTKLEAIKQLWSFVWEAIKDYVLPVVDLIVQGIDVAITILKDIINIALSVIKGDWGEAWDGCKQLVSDIWDGIKTLVSAAIETVKTIVRNAMENIKSAFSSAWNSVKSTVSNAFSSIKSAVSSGISSVVSTVASLPGKVTSALGNLGSLLFSSGASLIQGFLNGIRSMVSSAASCASEILSAIRSFFPFSPAKRGPFSGHGYTTYSGRALMQGFASGISSSASNAVGAMRSAMRAVEEETYGSDRFGGLSVSAHGGASSLVPVTISGNTFSVREEADIDKIAYKLNQLIARQARMGA